jgi:hypothetical protein
MDYTGIFRYHIRAQPNQLAYRFHSVPTVCSHIQYLHRFIEKVMRCFVRMCAADTTGIS